MKANARAAGKGARRSRQGWSLRTRVFAVVGLSVVPAVLGAVVGLNALAMVNGEVVQINQQSVSTMVSLSDLRDMEGDMRLLVRDYLVVPANQRADVEQKMLETDARLDADAAAYLKDHGSTTDEEGVLATKFVAQLALWRTVRDEQVLAAVKAGSPATAEAAAMGGLRYADDAMAAPLDKVLELEAVNADNRVRQAQLTYSRARMRVALVIALGLVAGALVAWFLIRRQVALLALITTVVSSGDLSARVATADRSDVGQLGQSLDRMMGQLADQREEIDREQATRERQLTENFTRQRHAERELRTRAQEVIDETSTAVLSELQGVVVQAAAVRQASDEIYSRVTDAGTVTANVVGRASSADTVVAEVNESLHRVGGIAQLIAGVAQQTNLLALNATIEAARAGEAGRGFSVVASEVKELAAETGRSTDEISTTVGALESGASAMAGTIQAITEGVSSLGEANALVGEMADRQRAAVERMDECVQEAVARIHSMSQLTDRLERRAMERILIGAGAVLDAGGSEIECKVIDLSDAGARVSVAAGSGLAPGRTVTLKLQLPADDRVEHLPLNVLRVDGDGGQEIAGTFTDLPADTRARLRQYMESLTTV